MRHKKIISLVCAAILTFSLGGAVNVSAGAEEEKTSVVVTMPPIKLTA